MSCSHLLPLLKKNTFLICYIIFIGIHVSYANSGMAYETALPLQFNTGNATNGLPSLSIQIEGKSLPLLLDTGASNYEIVLSRHALENIHVRYLKTKKCGKTMSETLCMEEFILPKIQVGKFTLRNVRGGVMSKLWGGNEEGFIETEASKNGVIGLKLLLRYGVLLDYAHSQLILTFANTYPKKYNIDQWINIPFKLQGGIFTCSIIDGVSQNLIWDTGALPSIIRETSKLKAKSLMCKKNKYYSGTDCHILKAKKIFINKTIIPTNWFLLSTFDKSLFFDGIIGSNYFEQNTIFFDFNNKRIYIHNNSFNN